MKENQNISRSWTTVGFCEALHNWMRQFAGTSTFCITRFWPNSHILLHSCMNLESKRHVIPRIVNVVSGFTLKVKVRNKRNKILRTRASSSLITQPFRDDSRAKPSLTLFNLLPFQAMWFTCRLHLLCAIWQDIWLVADWQLVETAANHRDNACRCVAWHILAVCSFEGYFTFYWKINGGEVFFSEHIVTCGTGVRRSWDKHSHALYNTHGCVRSIFSEVTSAVDAGWKSCSRHFSCVEPAFQGQEEA